MTVTEAHTILLGRGNPNPPPTFAVPQELLDEAHRVLREARQKLVKDFQGRT